MRNYDDSLSVLHSTQRIIRSLFNNPQMLCRVIVNSSEDKDILRDSFLSCLEESLKGLSEFDSIYIGFTRLSNNQCFAMISDSDTNMTVTVRVPDWLNIILQDEGTSVSDALLSIAVLSLADNQENQEEQQAE